MNDLEKYFYENNKRLVYKLTNYFEVYDRHFSRFRNKEITILEIGVSQGGSLQMWKEYFGDKATIYGIDIDQNCKQLEEENIHILIGSQSDRTFLREVVKTLPQFDILIDDGGHTMQQQIISYEELFGHVKDGGVYLCEDLHTSYFLSHGGGHKRRGSFIEYSKNFIDYLNAHYSEQRSLKVNYFTKNVTSVHYYDSIIVVEKQSREKPTPMKTGVMSFEPQTPSKGRIYRGIKKSFVVKRINKMLRFVRLKSFLIK